MTDGGANPCAECEEPAPPGQALCPACEDAKAARVSVGMRPAEPPTRTPPHGNTSR